MLVINYNGNKPTTDYFKYSVQGNNKADRIRFLVSLNQNGLVFDENYHIYAKVQCEDDGFYDKVELSEIEFDDSENLLKADFILESKHTSHKQIEVSLCCENISDEIVWQTQIVKVSIANGINSEEEIGNNYPTIIAQLQKQIDELKQQGGGGGSNDVEIKRVYLTYDDKKSIRCDYLGAYRETERFINDSTRIWVNFETTPISLAIEDEIKKGRFVIRLDYPLRNRNQITKIFNEGAMSFDRQRITTKRNGVGARGYLYSFNEDLEGLIGGIKYKDILLKSLIHISESDIKTNDYGEKYVHKKVSLSNYINNMCKFIGIDEIEPITNEWINNNQNGMDFFDDYLDERYAIGIPHTFNIEGDDNLWAGTQRMKMYGSGSSFPAVSSPFGRTNSVKINPAFSCYTPLKIRSINDVELESPYYINSRKHKSFTFDFYNGETMVMGDSEGSYGKHTTKKAYMCARPRCCILNDNWETSEKAFIKKFPQSDQQIRLYCKNIYNIGELDVGLMPIFRMLITQK